ncbi:hypothetical protein SDC9_186935 [bioreactor metagenome]|uniref:Uncharacterized protein n=1 Tax=bioreactor metagenome TaxID=1076179 RepID=A0A645HK90_9ZZZZ
MRDHQADQGQIAGDGDCAARKQGDQDDQDGPDQIGPLPHADRRFLAQAQHRQLAAEHQAQQQRQSDDRGDAQNVPVHTHQAAGSPHRNVLGNAEPDRNPVRDGLEKERDGCPDQDQVQG